MTWTTDREPPNSPGTRQRRQYKQLGQHLVGELPVAAEVHSAGGARVITDQLVRWATRDGGDSSRAVAAICSVLDEHLAGR